MDLFIHWLGHVHTKRRHNEKAATDDRYEAGLGIENPITELEHWHELAEQEMQDNDVTEVITNTEHTDCIDDDTDCIDEKGVDIESGLVETCNEHHLSAPIHEESQENRKESQDEEDAKLVHMGLTTAIAIGLHNFPEGLAGFVAALNDVRVGFVFAFAIAIHNVPEGLCVALPIYYGTGSRWKAFGYACISGVFEPIGALLGWLILTTVFTPTVYAILFGIVAGMMVFIVIKELLPTAHRYDPEDTVVSYCVIFGMAIMAISLILFAI